MKPLHALGSAEFWLRLFYMVLFVLAWQLAEFVLLLVVLGQLVWRLLFAKDHPCLVCWGDSLGQFARQIASYLTNAEAVKPWPFVEWPGRCGRRARRLVGKDAS